MPTTDFLDIALLIVLMATCYFVWRVSGQVQLLREDTLGNSQHHVSVTTEEEVVNESSRRPEKWVIGDPNQPTISLVPISRGAKVTADLPDAIYKQTNLPQPVIDRLQALLRSVPDLVQSVDSIGRYKIIFSAGTMVGLQTGTLELTQASNSGWLAVAQDVNTKRFVEIGHVAGQLNLIAPVNAVWQIMAVITAQKYLTAIDKRLHGLEHGVLEIINWLHTEQIGELSASYAYLQQIAPVLEAGQCSPIDIFTYSNAIEMAELRCLSVIMASKLRLQPTLDAMKTTQEAKNLISKPDYDKYLMAIRRHSGGIISAIYVRLLASQLKALLPVNQQVNLDRLDDINLEVNAFTQSIDNAFDMIDACQPEIDIKNRLLGGRESASRFKATMSAEIDAAWDDITKHLDQAIELIPEITNEMKVFVNDSKQAISFEVEIDAEARIVLAQQT